MNFAPDTPLESFLRETFLPQHCRSRAYSYNYIAAARWLQRHLRRPPMLADLNAPTLTAFLADAAAMGASKKRVVTLKRSFIWLWRCAGELDLCPACPIPRGCRQAALPRPEGKPGTLVDLFNKRYQPENLADCESDRELAYFGIFRAMRKCFHRDLRIKELSPAVVAKYLAYLKDKGRSSGTLKGHRC